VETHEQAGVAVRERVRETGLSSGDIGWASTNANGEILVRWSDDGHVSRLCPGSNAYVEHRATRRGRQEVGR
jgi:hypothetical protein